MIACDPDRLHGVFHHLCLVARDLAAQPFQQLRAGDSIRKSGKVVGARNQQRATVAGVHNRCLPAKSRQIYGRGQPRGPTAYDQAVKHNRVRLRKFRAA